MKKKSIALIMAAVMLFGATVGGVIAWLTDETTEVKNTFTNTAKIDIKLDEQEYEDGELTGDRTEIGNEYDMIPGTAYIKDPMVTVTADSEECWVYIKVIETNNTVTGIEGDIVQYNINTTDWTFIGNATDGNPVYAYYKTINPAVDTVLTTTSILATDNEGNNILINPEITSDKLATLDPELKFLAYAVQRANLDTATEAWTSAFGVLTVTP